MDEEKRSREEREKGFIFGWSLPPRLHPRRVEECPPPAGVGTPRRRKAAADKKIPAVSLVQFHRAILTAPGQSAARDCRAARAVRDSGAGPKFGAGLGVIRMILVTVCFISTADIAPKIPALPTSFSRKGWRIRLGVQFESITVRDSVCYSALYATTWQSGTTLHCSIRICPCYSIQYVKLISRSMQNVSTIPN